MFINQPKFSAYGARDITRQIDLCLIPNTICLALARLVLHPIPICPPSSPLQRGVELKIHPLLNPRQITSNCSQIVVMILPSLPNNPAQVDSKRYPQQLIQQDLFPERKNNPQHKILIRSRPRVVESFQEGSNRPCCTTPIRMTLLESREYLSQCPP